MITLFMITIGITHVSFLQQADFNTAKFCHSEAQVRNERNIDTGRYHICLTQKEVAAIKANGGRVNFHYQKGSAFARSNK